jgi:hypothetical protein
MSQLHFGPAAVLGESRVLQPVFRDLFHNMEYPGIGWLPEHSVPLTFLPCVTPDRRMRHECLLSSGYDLPFLREASDTRKSSLR